MTLAQKRAALVRVAKEYHAEADKLEAHMGQRAYLPGGYRMTATDWDKHDADYARRGAAARYVAAVLAAAVQILDGGPS